MSFDMGLTKPAQTSGKPAQTSGGNAAERVLAFCATTGLVLGILFSLMFARSMAGHILINFWDPDQSKATLAFWGVFLGGLILSLWSWACIMVFVNMSNNLRQIKDELEEIKDELEERNNE